MARSLDHDPTWIGVREVMRLGMQATTVYRLALLGSIRYRAEPGRALQFHRDDVMKYRPSGDEV
jgi:hypothetical protein